MSASTLTIITSVFVAVIGSGSATAIVQHLLEKSKSDPTRDGVRLLLQDKVEYLAIKAIKSGEITYSKLKFLRASYHAYKAMQGNGDLESLMEDVENLPIKYER